MSKTAQELNDINNRVIEECSQKLIAGIDIEIEKCTRLLLRRAPFSCSTLGHIVGLSQQEFFVLRNINDFSKNEIENYIALYEKVKTHYESLGFKVEIINYSTESFYHRSTFLISW